MYQGELTKSLEAWRRAMAINEAVLAEDPKDARAQVGLGSIYERVGWLVAMTSASTDLSYELKSLDMRKAMCAADPANLGRQEALASSYATLGDVEVIFASKSAVAVNQRREHWARAESRYKQALDILVRLRARGALRGAESTEPDRVAKEIARCEAALAKGHQDCRLLGTKDVAPVLTSEASGQVRGQILPDVHPELVGWSWIMPLPTSPAIGGRPTV
jgi:hypothetical protein